MKMKNRMLVISDIHGNLEALNAVLRHEEYEKLVVLGDLTDYGPDPDEVITKIRTTADIILMGNHDYANAFNVDCACSYSFKELSVKTRAYFKPFISKENMVFLKTLPLDAQLDNDGQPIYMVHAAPTDKLYKYLSPEITDFALEHEIKNVHAIQVFLGHTHKPMLRHIASKIVLNPGSVGQPRDGDWRASYAIVTDTIQLKRVKYNINHTILKLKNTGLEKHVKTRLIEVLKNGK